MATAVAGLGLGLFIGFFLGILVSAVLPLDQFCIVKAASAKLVLLWECPASAALVDRLGSSTSGTFWAWFSHVLAERAAPLLAVQM